MQCTHLCFAPNFYFCTQVQDWVQKKLSFYISEFYPLIKETKNFSRYSRNDTSSLIFEGKITWIFYLHYDFCSLSKHFKVVTWFVKFFWCPFYGLRAIFTTRVLQLFLKRGPNSKGVPKRWSKVSFYTNIVLGLSKSKLEKGRKFLYVFLIIKKTRGAFFVLRHGGKRFSPCRVSSEQAK